jgi:glycosyltransferase involved in cell wall biosynthesis
MASRRKFLFLESFHGGSHREFAEGLRAHSRHGIDLVTLPARFWKWRMRGAALHFLKKVPSLEGYHGLIATDLMSLSDFKALHGGRLPPALVYFHESQLTYPLAPDERIDYQFGFTDITTALAADRVLFNSRTHFEAFFERLPGFLNMMPEFVPKWATEEIRKKSGILHPGCRFSGRPIPETVPQPPLVIWNHRWEFDKDPDAFFEALDRTAEKKIDFRVALLGENFQAVPKAFAAARKRLGHRIVRYGYVENREAYFDWLYQGTVVVSTAMQENFGISVVEAVRSGCLPLLPDRLSYPEIIPREFHRSFLYSDPADLVEKLSLILTRPERFRDNRAALSEAMGRYGWERVIDRYDDALERLAGG